MAGSAETVKKVWLDLIIISICFHSLFLLQSFAVTIDFLGWSFHNADLDIIILKWIFSPYICVIFTILGISGTWWQCALHSFWWCWPGCCSERNSKLETITAHVDFNDYMKIKEMLQLINTMLDSGRGPRVVWNFFLLEMRCILACFSSESRCKEEEIV